MMEILVNNLFEFVFKNLFTVMLIGSGMLFLASYLFDKSDKGYVRFLIKVMPPFAMLLLVFIPIDLVTSLFWVSGFVFVVYSVLRVICLQVQWVGWRHKSDQKKRLVKESFLRPILCILFFILAIACVNQSKTSANTKAIELAFKMQGHVLKHGECIDDAFVGDGVMYGEYGTQYHLGYHCDIDGRHFSYSVRIDRDNSFWVKSDFSGQMVASFGHYSDMHKVEISDGIDLSLLARMKRI